MADEKKINSLSKTEEYKSWRKDLPSIRSAFLLAISEYEIPSKEVRIDNFLGSLSHELEKDALEELAADGEVTKV